jgi:hypothetical protein
MTTYVEFTSIRRPVGRLVSKTTPFVRLLLKNSSNKRELRENQLTDSSTLFNDVNKFLPTLSVLIDRFVLKFDKW